ncbi:hypothetical protein EYC80_008092 [Monilinia laxa]|uniref:RING-type domain-containing protein n=1 Tax=Monilinia laxa TaxID=61186 RepID=A0A5N6JTE7_MONLA|nr:hypothetical protein EYC80_008092 [Monilinia laxa]
MEEDNDIDMPNAPPPPPQPTVSRCPHPQASQNSMQMAYTGNPSVIDPWATYPGSNMLNPAVHGFSTMPPVSYGGPSQGNVPPTTYTAASNYTATPSYAAHFAQWSHNTEAQITPYPGYHDPQTPGSRRFLPPSSNPPLGGWPPFVSSMWDDLDDEYNAITRYPEPNHVARNNNYDQAYVEYPDDNGPTGLTRTQVARRRRERINVATEMEALQNPPSNVCRRLAEAQRRVGASAHAIMRDSDTEDDESGDSDDYALEEALRHSAYLRASSEDAGFALRGRLWSVDVNKRIPTKEFLLSLESLKPDDLAKEEKTCMICYNEFGVKNPEGVSEQPLRIPKCKHIFGAICIKKWFKENDTCPYCRDKVPSESCRKVMMRQARQIMQDQTRRHYLSIARSTEAVHPFAALNLQEAQNMSSGDRTEPTRQRPSAADAAEPRRRVSRGRLVAHRSAHLSTRPRSRSSVRAYAVPMPRLTNEPDNSSQTHVRHNSNSERVSPAIAVGSTINNEDQQSTPLSANSLGQSANPNIYMSPTSLFSTNQAFPTSHMYPTSPPYSQNRPIAFGSVRQLQQENPSQFYHYHSQSPHEDNSVALQNRQQAMQQRQQTLMQQERFRQEEAEGEHIASFLLELFSSAFFCHLSKYPCAHGNPSKYMDMAGKAFKQEQEFQGWIRNFMCAGTFRGFFFPA